jgi:DNA-binding transcriptional LysR family regulator
MLSQRALEVFLAVMRAGSVSGAAARLSISQPAASRLIRDLEAQTGLLLFDRVGNRISPTEAAHALASEVERAFVGLSEIEVAAREIGRGRRERLRIASMPVLSMTLIPDVVADIHGSGRLRDLDIDILSFSTPSVVHMVASRQVVLGFVAPVMETPEIRLLTHERVPMRCIMGPDDPLVRCAHIGLDDLSDRAVIGYSSTTTSGAMLDQLFAVMHAPPRILARARLSSVVSALSLRGLGVGLVDAFTAAEHEARGGVSRPLDITETFGFSVITSRLGAPHPAAQMFLDGVAAHVARFADWR